MAIVPESPRAIPAGLVTVMLAAACQQCQVQEEGLLDWAVSKEQVVVLLADGRKVKFVVGPLPLTPSPTSWEGGQEKEVVTGPAIAAGIDVTNGAGVATNGAELLAGHDTNGPELVTPGGGIRAGGVTNGAGLATGPADPGGTGDTNGAGLATKGGVDVDGDGTKDIPPTPVGLRRSEAIAVMHRIAARSAGKPAGRAKK